MAAAARAALGASGPGVPAPAPRGRGTHRGVFGTRLAIAQVLARCGWTVNTAFVERLHLDLCPRVAAIGRRGHPLGQGAAGVREQGALVQVEHNGGLPHARLRQPLLVSAVPDGGGAAQGWRPCPPARAAGLTDHGWSRKAGLFCRVPPWLQPQTAYHRLPVDERGVAWLACAQMQGNRGERGVENRLGGFITG
jgi:hypothetical protein